MYGAWEAGSLQLMQHKVFFFIVPFILEPLLAGKTHVPRFGLLIWFCELLKGVW